MSASIGQVVIGGYIYNVKASFQHPDGKVIPLAQAEGLQWSTVAKKIQDLTNSLETILKQPSGKSLSSYKIIQINNQGVTLDSDTAHQWNEDKLTRVKDSWKEVHTNLKKFSTLAAQSHHARAADAIVPDEVALEFTTDHSRGDAADDSEPPSPSSASTSPRFNATPNTTRLQQVANTHTSTNTSSTIEEEMVARWTFADNEGDFDNKIKLFMILADMYAKTKKTSENKNDLKDIRGFVLSILRRVLNERVNEKFQQSWWATFWLSNPQAEKNTLKNAIAVEMANAINGTQLQNLYDVSNLAPNADEIKTTT